MNINLNKCKAFLYRRLANLVTCRINLSFGDLMLTTKYNVASAQDVFFHPFYWQIADFLTAPPQVIMDCGAHCGHFSILAETCIQARFNSSATNYVLIEPNPKLQGLLRANLHNAGMLNRSQIIEGAVGMKSTSGFIDLRNGNYLSAQTTEKECPGSLLVQGVVPSGLCTGEIDVLKVDIEGAEATLFDYDEKLLQKVKLLLLEWHTQADESRLKVMSLIKGAGFGTIGRTYTHGSHELMAFSK
jgi:FkbM family methyltransferase